MLKSSQHAGRMERLAAQKRTICIRNCEKSNRINNRIEVTFIYFFLPLAITVISNNRNLTSN
jgi:hypothetical protein